MQTKDGKDRCQPYRCSILSENYNGEPIAFEWKIFPGTTASELLRKIQKDLEGQRIRSESFSDRVIFMSMFNDIDLDKKGRLLHYQFEKNQNVCVKIHWRTLGILGSRRRKQVVSRIGSQLWQLGTPCFTNCGGIREFWKPGILRGKSAGSRNIENEKWSKYYPPQWRVWQHWFSFSELSMWWISSVFTEQSQSCAESSQRQILERQVKLDQKVLEEHPEKFRSSRKNSSHWLIFRDYRLLQETECFRTWRISNRCPPWAKLNLFEQLQNSSIQSR